MFSILVFPFALFFSHVYNAWSMEGAIWEWGGLEKRQMGVLDGPLRGSAGVGKAEVE